MAELEKVMQEKYGYEIAEANSTFIGDLKRLHLGDRKVQQIAKAVEKYLRRLQQIAELAQSEADKPTKKGWTMEDIQPLLDQGAQLIAPIPEIKKQ